MTFSALVRETIRLWRYWRLAHKATAALTKRAELIRAAETARRQHRPTRALHKALRAETTRALRASVGRG